MFTYPTEATNDEPPGHETERDNAEDPVPQPGQSHPPGASLLSSCSVRNIDIYHSSFHELAPVVAEAGQQMPLILGQAVVDKQHRTKEKKYIREKKHVWYRSN